MNNLVKNVGIWAVILMVVLVVVKQFDARQPGRDAVSYSEFMDSAKSGKVESDNSAIGLYYAKGPVDKQVRGVLFQTPDSLRVFIAASKIQPNEDSVVVNDIVMPLPPRR